MGRAKRASRTTGRTDSSESCGAGDMGFRAARKTSGASALAVTRNSSTPRIAFQDRVWFTCEHCGERLCESEGNKEYVLSKVFRQIDRKIRNGDWKHAVV